MRLWALALPLACLPLAVVAESIHSIQVINDMRSQIVSFTIYPAGSNQGAEVEFANRLFDYGTVVNLEFRDDSGCLRDFRTLLSDGEKIVARNFNVCTRHAYRPGTSFNGAWRRP